MLKNLISKDNIRWTSLAILSLVNIFWFIFMGNCYLYGDMAESVGQAAGTIPTSTQHTLLIVLFLRIFWFTGNAILIWNITMLIGLTLAMWYLVITINKLGAKWGWTLGLTLFFAFWPQYFWIVSFSSKDQLISIAFMVLVGTFINWTQKSKVTIPDFVILGVTLIFVILTKTVNIAVVFAVIFLALKFKKYLRHILVTGLIATILGVGLSSLLTQTLVVNNNLGQNRLEQLYQDGTLTKTTDDTPHGIIGFGSGYMPMSWMNQVAAIFQQNGNISKENDEFFSSLNGAQPGNRQWAERRHPILADFANSSLINGEAKTTAEFTGHFLSLCFANLDKCLGSWFAEQSGFFVPKYIQGPATGAPARPIMVSLSMIPETNKTEFLPTNYSEMPTAVSQRFCNDSSSASIPLTQDQYHKCFVKELGQTQGDLLFANVSQYIKDNVYDKQISPDFTKALVHFWAHDAYVEGSNPFLAFFSTIFLDGFWLFWMLIIILFVAYKKKLARLIPALWIPTLFYIAYIIFAPVAYERYVWPMFCIIPFLFVATFGIDNKRFMIGKPKKRK